MDFNLTEDRRMLQDSLTRYLGDKYPVDHRNKVAYALPCHDPAKWAEMAELGALFALAREDAGGFGGTGFDHHGRVRGAWAAPSTPNRCWGLRWPAACMTKIGADQEGLLSGATKYAVAVGEVEAPYESGPASPAPPRPRVTAMSCRAANHPSMAGKSPM
jgi:hypothetical protein